MVVISRRIPIEIPMPMPNPLMLLDPRYPDESLVLFIFLMQKVFDRRWFWLDSSVYVSHGDG